MKHEFTISCCLCSASHKINLDLPEGWSARYKGTDEEHGFCPAHSKIKGFTENCAGCVGGWGDCGLWSSFAYNKLEFTERDFDVIRSGKCPKRVNGSMIFDSATGKLEHVDISDPGTTESGEMLVQAIKDYCAKYHKKEEPAR